MFTFDCNRVKSLFDTHTKVKLDDICNQKEIDIIEKEIFWESATMNNCEYTGGWFQVSYLVKEK